MKFRLLNLVVLNIALQVFDGAATYAGQLLGYQEANPLIRGAFGWLGVVPALILAKAVACGCILVLYLACAGPCVVLALMVTAVTYAAISLGPWFFILLAEVTR